MSIGTENKARIAWKMIASSRPHSMRDCPFVFNHKTVGSC